MGLAKATLEDVNRDGLKEMYCSIMGSIIKRNRLTHAGLSELLNNQGFGKYKKGTIAAYATCKPKEIPLCFIESIHRGGLCNENEYDLLIKILLLYNTSVTVDLLEMRKNADNVEDFVDWFSAIIANKLHNLRSYIIASTESEDEILSKLNEDFKMLYKHQHFGTKCIDK